MGAYWRDWSLRQGKKASLQPVDAGVSARISSSLAPFSGGTLLARSKSPVDDMTLWTQPEYSPAEVDAAGRTLISPTATDAELRAARRVISNYRAAHAYALNTFQMTLRRKARKIHGDAAVAQRLKRLSSISSKLERIDRLALSDLQDMAGCRAVLPTVAHVAELVADYEASSFSHTLVRRKDYIGQPRRRSGYRSHHLIYKYSNPKLPQYEGQQIEIQVRSQPQHAWATAVEVAGTFTRQALKSSHESEAGWLRFFKLMASHIAMQEGTPPVRDTPHERGALEEAIRRLEGKLRIEERLAGFGLAAERLREKKPRGHFTLLMLYPDRLDLDMRGFPKDKEKEATAAYLEAEQVPGVDAVLVSVDSLTSLRMAYPNYFLDTVRFLEILMEILY